MPGTPRIDTFRMRALRLWTRLRLPRTPRLLQNAGVWNQSLWRGSPRRVCRGRWHGYRMSLDIGDYHQRGAYFYGRMLDVHVQLCMLAALRPGDTCVDVGANIGLLSMLASHAVGPRGRVIAFEPNPEVFELLTWHLRENRLKNVETLGLALSDHNARMNLTVPQTGNTGAGTLGVLPPRHGGKVGAVYEVDLRIGDEVLGKLPECPAMIKLDVEGHEPAALRGLRRTIERHRPAILLESNVEMLPANGTSVGELFELLGGAGGMGYEVFALSAAWDRWGREWRLRLHPMPISWRPVKTQNVLFLRPDGVHVERLRAMIQRLP